MWSMFYFYKKNYSYFGAIKKTYFYLTKDFIMIFGWGATFTEGMEFINKLNAEIIDFDYSIPPEEMHSEIIHFLYVCRFIGLEIPNNDSFRPTITCKHRLAVVKKSENLELKTLVKDSVKLNYISI